MDWTAYEVDERNELNDRRRGQFREGWNRAVAGEVYKSEETLQKLHWENLGYRLGRIFGPTSEELINEMCDWCGRHYQERGPIK